MDSKLVILNLSDRIKWKNWPTWLKGLFFLWPSIGPAYLFITRTPSPIGGEGELNALMTNIEYQNYFIVVFLGFWSINLLILGLTWTMGSLVSKGYRYYLRSKSQTVNSKESTETVKKIKKRYPVLKRKRDSSDPSKSDKVE